jgi:hypothetical protein
MLSMPGQSLPAFGSKATTPEGYLLGLWAHECQRVFADKLISEEEKAWVQTTVADLCKQVGPSADSKVSPAAILDNGMPDVHARPTNSWQSRQEIISSKRV